MKGSFTAQLDSQAIRQGLLSIRKSQIELLKELKSETMQLTKNPIRFESSTEGSTPQENGKNEFVVQSSKKETNSITPKSHKAENIKGDFKLEYSPQRMTSQYIVCLSPSPLALQKQTNLGFTGEKEKSSSKTYLQEENKMLNDTLEKLLASRSADKQRIRDLESYAYFSQRMFVQIIRQFLSGSSVLQILTVVENDLTINRDIYSKYADSSHFHLLDLLKHQHFDFHPQNGRNHNKKERQLLLQYEQLKQRVAMFQRAEHQKNNSRASLQVENNRLLQQLEIAKKRFFQLQKEIQRLNNDNKELAIFWQKENSQRKTLATQLQKAKKELVKIDQNYQLITKLQKDLINTQKQLKQKESNESNIQESMKRLSEAIVHFREENENLKRQIKSIEEIKENLKKENHSFNKQAQNQMKTQILQQTAMLANYQQQIHDLRQHITSLKYHQQMMLQTQAKQRQKEIISQEIYWKKVNAIKLDSAIDHLWQVKEMQYHNINEIFRPLLQKQFKM